jgi:hypothetical protein
MKTITIFLTSLLLAMSAANAQFSENFDQDIINLGSNCWAINQVNYTTTSADVINGTGSAYTNPPTSGSGERTLTTPFLNVSSTSLTVSFNYKTSSKINGNSTRTIQIGLVDVNGNFVSLQTLTMDKNSPTTVLNHNATYTLATTGVYRLEIRIGGATGDGNSRVIFDDLSASASAYYGPVSHCNPAAVAVNDTYNPVGISAVTGNVLANDNIPSDNEVYSSFVVTPPSSGTLVLAANGSFTFTPGPTFTGGPVTFTYQVTDNGYPATTSNIATVTLNFPTLAMLPIVLKDFKASLSGGQVNLDWLVENNEDGDYFEVQKSGDGNQFGTFTTIFANNHNTKYSASDNANSMVTYYRLRIVNLDGTVSFSKVVAIKTSVQSSALQVRGTTIGQVLTFTYDTPETFQTQVQVYSLNGAKVQAANMSMNKGEGQYSLDISKLSAGMYVISVAQGNARQAVKFIKR